MPYGPLLFGLGLFPAYVSILMVERYYTAFWTGLWNFYGLFLTGLGLALDQADPLIIGAVVSLGGVIAAVIYMSFYGDVNYYVAHGVRAVGASLVATSINWGLFVGFTYGFWLGVLAMVLHAAIMLLIQASVE